MLVAGPLADYALEPAMQTGGAMAGALSWLVESGPGAGMALVFVGGGLLAYVFPTVREVESILPDHNILADAQPSGSREPASALW